MLSFCDDVDRYLRDMHIPDAIQAVTKAGHKFGYLMIDRGTLMTADLDGWMQETTGTCATALIKSMEINMLDWEVQLYRKFCHITMDLDPSTQDLVVEPHPETIEAFQQAIDDLCNKEYATRIQALVRGGRTREKRRRAATCIQECARAFLRAPIDLT